MADHILTREMVIPFTESYGRILASLMQLMAYLNRIAEAKEARLAAAAVPVDEASVWTRELSEESHQTVTLVAELLNLNNRIEELTRRLKGILVAIAKPAT